MAVIYCFVSDLCNSLWFQIRLTTLARFELYFKIFFVYFFSQIEVEDTIGPVSTVVINRFDYYLFFSWCFIIFVSFDFVWRKTQFKQVFIKLMKDLFSNNRLLPLPQPPYRPMIQNRNEQRTAHLHSDWECEHKNMSFKFSITFLMQA